LPVSLCEATVWRPKAPGPWSAASLTAGLHAIEALPRCLAALEMIGHTSGRDALAGAVIALRARHEAAPPSATNWRTRIAGSPR
jgi:hypothetical protein